MSAPLGAVAAVLCVGAGGSDRSSLSASSWPENPAPAVSVTARPFAVQPRDQGREEWGPCCGAWGVRTAGASEALLGHSLGLSQHPGDTLVGPVRPRGNTGTLFGAESHSAVGGVQLFTTSR